MSKTEKKEQGVAVMFMVIVCIFMLCNAPAMTSNIVEAMNGQAVELTQISNLLVVFNSSINIFVYCTFG